MFDILLRERVSKTRSGSRNEENDTKKLAKIETVAPYINYTGILSLMVSLSFSSLRIGTACPISGTNLLRGMKTIAQITHINNRKRNESQFSIETFDTAL